MGVVVMGVVVMGECWGVVVMGAGTVALSARIRLKELINS